MAAVSIPLSVRAFPCKLNLKLKLKFPAVIGAQDTLFQMFDFFLIFLFF